MSGQLHISRQYLWSDSIFEIKIPNPNNQAIVDFYELASKSHKGDSRSNIGGWQFAMKTGMCEEYDHIMDRIVEGVNHIANSVMDMNLDIKMSNSWINTNLLGAKNSFHTHPGCLFSGVYYVKVPKTGDPGMINFVREGHHLIESTLSFFADHYAEKRLRKGGDDRDPQWISHMTIPPVEGSALIFPSWYGHEVYTSLSEKEDRIAVGMNFSPRLASENNK